MSRTVSFRANRASLTSEPNILHASGKKLPPTIAQSRHLGMGSDGFKIANSDRLLAFATSAVTETKRSRLRAPPAAPIGARMRKPQFALPTPAFPARLGIPYSHDAPGRFICRDETRNSAIGRESSEATQPPTSRWPSLKVMFSIAPTTSLRVATLSSNLLIAL